MVTYVIKRVLTIVPVLLLLSLGVFSLLSLTPGDGAALILGDNADLTDIAALRSRMGLDQPFLPRYLGWLKQAIRGDLGISSAQSLPVGALIAGRLRVTLALGGYAMLIALALALPTGVASALCRDRPVDHLLQGAALLGVSLPSFLTGIALMGAFAVALRWFPVAGYVPPSAGFGPHLRSLTLPALTLGLMYAALIMRITRAALVETLSSGYVRMARAKGMSNLAIVTGHALPNALVPVIAVAAESFVGALSGATVVETLFGIPGIGSLVVASLGRRDYPVIQGVVLLAALVNVAVNLGADLLYGLADPRIRVGAP
jgi:peptide/nickel transport system permease protein